MTHETFNTIYKKYYSPLVMYANKRLNDLQASEDVVQNVFIKLFGQQDEDFEKEIAVKTWLYVSVQNGCFNILQSNKRTTPLREDFELIIKSDVLAELVTMINSIAPQRCKETLKLYLDGYSLKEIASYQQVEYRTAVSQRARGIYLIKKMLRIK